jgi:hypothetical protein
MRFNITVSWILLGAILCSCGGVNPSIQTLDALARSTFVPIDPLPADQVTHYDPSGVKLTEPWATLAPGSRSELLPIYSSNTVIEKLDASGSAKFLTASVSGDVGSYRLTLDFLKCRVEEIPRDGMTSPTGYQRVGVGLRIVANVLTTEANIDMGSLMALGLAAKEGSVHGDLSIEVIGLDSASISQLFPMPSQIDQSSIQKVLEAAATIKSKLGDQTTILTPHIMAIRIDQDARSLNSVKEYLATSSATRREQNQRQQQPHQQQQQQQQQQ